jgi:hypothetical protein
MNVCDNCADFLSHGGRRHGHVFANLKAPSINVSVGTGSISFFSAFSFFCFVQGAGTSRALIPMG